jgi:lipoate-protein ligase B
MSDLEILNIGLTPYREAYELQLEKVSQVKEGNGESLIICSHHPVVTLGKKSQPEDIQGWTGSIEEIERGGKATYHGPGQIVIYPIIDLKKRGQNIAGFLEVMEASMIKVLQDLGLKARGNDERGKPEYTGVWLESDAQNSSKKIASIGVAVSRWVTFHGLAFNLESDPLAFTGISPCGFTTDTMTDLETVLLEKSLTKAKRSDIEDALTDELRRGFSKLLV